MFAGITPLPYKIVAIASGAAKLSFYNFVLWSIIARGLRFFFLVALVKHISPAIWKSIEFFRSLILIFFVIVLIGGFYMLRFL